MKNYKMKIFSSLAISIVFLILSIFFICVSDSEYVCTKDYYGLSGPSILFFGSLFLSIFPLIFLKESVYKAWAKFAVVAVPLLLLFIFLSPETSGGLFGSTSLFTRETAAMNGSVIFLILSYIIIAIQAWRTRKQ